MTFVLFFFVGGGGGGIRLRMVLVGDIKKCDMYWKSECLQAFTKQQTMTSKETRQQGAHFAQAKAEMLRVRSSRCKSVRVGKLWLVL